jgi:hypothetical protein
MSGKLYDAEAIRRAASGRWREVFEGLGFSPASLDGRHRPCPGCGGNDRFQFDDRDGSGSFLCYRGGGGLITGDGIAALMHFKGVEFREACSILGASLLGDSGRLAGGVRREGFGQVAPEPVAELAAPAFNIEALRAVCRGVGQTFDWWQAKSPVDLSAVTPEGFLSALYPAGERVLVFTSFRSQGDFVFWSGRGSYRLGKTPGITATPSPLPLGGPEGVWFLNQPVSGKWEPSRDKLTRRSAVNVTAWRYLVLEHDPAEGTDKAESFRLWLSFLAQAPLPIAAVYTSGGRSVHALLKLDGLTCKDDFDRVRRVIIHYLVPFGADPAAITAVRLTRLPGCLRGDSLQRLIYLNPSPDPGGVPVCQGGNHPYV